MSLKVEWDASKFFLVLDELEMELTREEAESLFVVLGNGLQDQDYMAVEEDNESN